ncbi:hypothetical protein [Catenovulum maritimum]|uniref:Uncharacterized protein n=1 Tax=Catenovulum maritimum TaxID=1513271 RepID=A0A0J8GWU2_9ALTE|nr:hypothetical protein [Catenovulum maritimum]KMT65754.1 hypothetical protein XM47_07035 [Catenovulum maritimum]
MKHVNWFGQVNVGTIQEDVGIAQPLNTEQDLTMSEKKNQNGQPIVESSFGFWLTLGLVVLLPVGLSYFLSSVEEGSNSYFAIILLGLVLLLGLQLFWAHSSSKSNRMDEKEDFPEDD